MTAVAIRRPAAAAAVAAARPAEPARRSVLLIAALAGGATLALRLALDGRSFDLFGDEVIYTDLGRSVISGGFPRYGGPFFLHGPAFYYLEAGWAWLAGHPGSMMGWVQEMRALNALLAAITAAALVLLATQASSLRAGALAGALFAVEPFCIRQNDRVLLETATMLWVLLGYLVFISLVGRLPRRRGWPRAVGAGLLFGCAVLIKDEAAIVTVFPLLAAAVFRWGPRLRLTLLTTATTVASYVVYVAVVFANGQFDAMWVAKTAGIERMLGMIQTTGFHSASGGSGSGSLSSRLLAEASYFATTYLVLVLGALAVLVLLRRGGQLQRVLGLVYCAAGVALGYALILGTLEEQELYLLVVPSLLIIPVAATLLPGRRRPLHSLVPPGRPRFARAALTSAAVALVLGINIGTCAQWLRQPDNGFARLLSYMATHVQAGAAVTDAAGGQDGDDVGQLALSGRYHVGLWLTPAILAQEHVQYVLVPWAEVDDGYSYLTQSEVRRLVSNGRRVFSFRGRTYGDLALYRLPVSSGRQANAGAAS